jgi:hypothetical protein
MSYENHKLSDTPKIVFVGFDEKPMDLAQTMIKKSNLSPKEQALQDYFKALYTVGESTL